MVKGEGEKEEKMVPRENLTGCERVTVQIESALSLTTSEINSKLSPTSLSFPSRNPMDLDTKTTNEKKGSFYDLKLKVRELESKLFEEKQRSELLQIEHDNHKSECLNLRETKLRLEMELKSFREREAKDQNMIQKFSGMVESYDKKLAEFMIKYGDEHSSLMKRNDAIVVKKEIEDNLDGEMSKRSKALVPLGRDVDDDNFEIVKWTKKRVIKEMWRRETSSAYAFMPYRVGKRDEEKLNRNLTKKGKTKLPDGSLPLIVSDNEFQISRKRNISFCRSRAYTGRPADYEQRLDAIDRAEKIQRNLSSGNPSFIRSMALSHVSGSFWLVLNPEFCHKHLGKSIYNLILEDESGLEYAVKYLGHVSALSGGWAGFAKAHKLELYDALLFELCEPKKFKVYIVKANEEPFEDSQNKLTNAELVEDQDANLSDIRNNSNKMNRRIKNGANNAGNNDFFSF